MRNMAEQFGFDFDDALLSDFTEEAPGAWLDPKLSLEQFDTLLAKARETVPGIPGLAGVLFGRGLDAASEEQARAPKDRRPWRRWYPPCPATEDEFDAFVALCRAGHGGHEFKVRQTRIMLTAALFVRDAGTLIARQWSARNRSVSFFPWRDPFFLRSFRDDSPMIEAPHHLWENECCAEKLASRRGDVANVPTFTLRGREYINSGMSYLGAYQECHAWTFRPVQDWTGPTYNYQSQCRAWDEGRTERGDRRGLVVRVRGKLCVLDGAARVFEVSGN